MSQQNGKIKVLVGLFILALAVRLIVGFNTQIISSDGPLYIEAATYYYNGEWKEAVSHPYHPLYPFLVSLAYRIVGNWEWAGLLVSIILSSLAVIPLYLIGQRLFAHPIALISAIFYIFHPHITRLSSSVLTTGAFILTLTAAVYFFMKALENWRYLSFVLAGLFALLGFLTRPDGIIPLLVFTLWLIFINFKTWWKGGLKRKVLALLTLFLPWLVIAIPYIVYMAIKTGEFTISQKLTLANLWALINPVVSPDAFRIMLEDLIKPINPWLLLLIIIGLIARKGSIKLAKSRDTWLIWSIFLGYLLAFLKFSDVFSRISKRHTTPLVAIIIFWGAAGLYLITKRLIRLKRDCLTEDSSLFRRWLLSGTLVTAIMFAFFIFQPLSKDNKKELPERKVGEWIKQYHKGAAQPIIVSNSNRIPYYGGGKIIRNYELTRLRQFGNNYNELIKNLKEQQVDYLVIDKTEIDAIIPDFTDRLKSNTADLEQIYPQSAETADKTNPFFVYLVHPVRD